MTPLPGVRGLTHTIHRLDTVFLGLAVVFVHFFLTDVTCTHMSCNVEDGRMQGYWEAGRRGRERWRYGLRLGPSDDPWRGAAGVLRVFSRSRLGPESLSKALPMAPAVCH